MAMNCAAPDTGNMEVLEPGPDPLTELGAVGIGMDRRAPPVHDEIVTELEHRDGYRLPLRAIRVSTFGYRR